MQMTLAEANKELKKLQVKYERLKNDEKDGSTFIASINENTESNRPNFDMMEYLKEVDKVVNEMKELKHKINVYNTTTKLFDVDITIDEALLLLPILNEEKERLYTLSSMPLKKRVPNGGFGSSIIDYQYVNFDIQEVKEKYEKVVERVNAVQFSLDKTNSTLLLEF